MLFIFNNEEKKEEKNCSPTNNKISCRTSVIVFYLYWAWFVNRQMRLCNELPELVDILHTRKVLQNLIFSIVLKLSVRASSLVSADHQWQAGHCSFSEMRTGWQNASLENTSIFLIVLTWRCSLILHSYERYTSIFSKLVIT